MIIMSIDLGMVRTGLAICDKFEMLASPLEVVEEKSREKLAEYINQKVHAYKCEMIVLGLPKNMNGSEGESAIKAREFSNMLKSIIEIPIVMWDERRTTISAQNYLNITDTRGKKRKRIIDCVSATIILQDYLDFRKHNLNS